MINICNFLGIDAQKFVINYSEPTFQRYIVNNSDSNVMSVINLPDYIVKDIGNFNLIEDIGKHGNLRWLRFVFDNLDEYKMLINSDENTKTNTFGRLKRIAIKSDDIFRTKYIKKNVECLKYIIDLYEKNPDKFSYEISIFSKEENKEIKKKLVIPELFNDDNLKEYITEGNLEFLDVALEYGYKCNFNVYSYINNIEVLRYFYEKRKIMPIRTIGYNSRSYMEWDKKENVEDYDTYIIGIITNDDDILCYAIDNKFYIPKYLYNLAYECGNKKAIIYLLENGYSSNEDENFRYSYNLKFNNSIFMDRIKIYENEKLECLKLIDNNKIKINYLNLIFDDIIYDTTDRIDILEYLDNWLQINFFSDEIKCNCYLKDMNYLESLSHTDNLECFKYFASNYLNFNNDLKKKIILDVDTSYNIFKYMYDNYDVEKDDKYIKRLVKLGSNNQNRNKKKLNYILAKALL
jgi:hypothetical protein